MTVDVTFAASGRFWKGNLHTHSTPRSNAALEPVRAHYREPSYDFLGLTTIFSLRLASRSSTGWASARIGSPTILGGRVHAPAAKVGKLCEDALTPA
jgi:hypothetical protein